MHHGTDQLLVQQQSIPDVYIYNNISAPISDMSQPSQSLCRFLSHLIDMSRPVEPCIKGHPKITDIIDPLDWLTQELNWSGFVLQSAGQRSPVPVDLTFISYASFTNIPLPLHSTALFRDVNNKDFHSAEIYTKECLS